MSPHSCLLSTSHIPCPRRILSETGRLLAAFLLGSAATVAGSVVAMAVFPLGRYLGDEGWKVRPWKAGGCTTVAWLGGCVLDGCARRGPGMCGGGGWTVRAVYGRAMGYRTEPKAVAYPVLGARWLPSAAGHQTISA